jgi:hypothetical protein
MNADEVPRIVGGTVFSGAVETADDDVMEDARPPVLVTGDSVVKTAL